MTTTLEQQRHRKRLQSTAPRASTPPPQRPATRAPQAPRRQPNPTAVIELAVAALMAAAVLPLSRVFATAAWIRPTIGAVVVTLGVGAAARRTRLGMTLSLVVQALAFGLYLGVLFVPDSLVLGVVPTPTTVTDLWALFLQGLELLPQRVAPAAVIPPLAFLAVAATGAIAAIADMLVHAGRAPLKAVVVALTLWAVPLSMAVQDGPLWFATVPMLAAVALLLLATSGADVLRWGRWIYPRGRGDGVSHGTFGLGGFVVSVSAIVAGLLLAGSLPGSGDPPWWQVRGASGSTLTANPIVQLRSNLVASGSEPIFTVQTPRPIYLRTTALDDFGEFEEWTTSGIRTRPLVDGLMATGTAEDAFAVDITVGDVSRADLVPMPYQPLRAMGGIGDAFQLDPRTGTVVLDEGRQIQPGDTYSVLAAVPRPTPEQLDEAGTRMPRDPLTRLPDNTPGEVAALAEDIVAEAGATTPFRQALAIQDELRTWEYSLDPPPGHDGTAMTQFLESRVGYCEQFAGTMAVMLRTLDIPARVAVGFTPGSLLEPGGDTYSVTWSNSHAWVEVLFGDLGWIAFEPTPRGDGNVLVPTSGDPSPRVLEQEPATVDAPPEFSDAEGAAALPIDDTLLLGVDPGENAGSFTPGSSSTRTSSSAMALIIVATLLVVAGVAIAWRRSRSTRAQAAPPVERILRAGGRVARTGAGLRIGPESTETDREYLRRLAAGSRGSAAWQELADVLTRARYAPTVTVEDAERAEQAAAAVLHQLTDHLSRRQRARVAAWGAITELRGMARRSAPVRWRAERMASSAH